MKLISRREWWWRRWGPAIAVCALCIAFPEAIWWSSERLAVTALNPPASYPTRAQANPETRSQYPQESWWGRTVDDPVALWTAVLTVFTGLLVLVSFRQFGYLRRADKTARIAANAARDAAKIATKTLAADHRAWIQIRLSPSSPLTFDQHGASLTVGYHLINSGDAPALKIFVRMWLIAQFANASPLQQHTNLCDDVRHKGSDNILTFALFPGETYPEAVDLGGSNIGARISKSALTKALELDPQKKHVHLYLCGCVNYTFVSDVEGSIHQTRFMHDVRRLDWQPIAVDTGPIPIQIMSALGGAGRHAD